MALIDTRLDERLRGLEERFGEVSAALSAPDAAQDRSRFTELSKAFAELEPVVEEIRAYRRLVDEHREAKELCASGDAEIRAMARDEVDALEPRLEAARESLKLLLVPDDPDDARNVVLEVRAGTGGDEATLFADEIFGMYARYADARGWKFETTDLSRSDVGGIKEAIAIVEGSGVYARLKFESGVHRVQRVPATEAQGRIHTSAVTVAVMPEAEEVEVDIDENELRIDTFCSSGPGGQSVNTTQSAVRIVHLPTQTVVQCQDEKSWHRNKARALQVLRSRLYDRMSRERHEEQAAERRGLIGSGDRSEKIRTYNFPQSRVTDHRIHLTVHALGDVLKGDLDTLIDALVAHDRAAKLEHVL